MTTKATNAARGIGAVMALGATALLATSMNGRRSVKKKLKKTADKAIKAIDAAMGGISYMMS